MVRSNRYWLWIIPLRYKGLWDLCREDRVLAMHYPPGWYRENKNQRLAAEIAEGDKIVAYLNDKRIGGIGTVTRSVYEAEKSDNWGDTLEYNYEYITRINVKWDFVAGTGWKYPQRTADFIGIGILNVATIHELHVNYYDGIRNWIEEQMKNSEDSTKDTQFQKRENLITATDLMMPESALRFFMIEKLEDIFGEGWYLFEDDEGKTGNEYRLKTGVADLIVINPEEESVILELKVVLARKKDVEQLEQYLKEYREMFDGKVKGILIAPGITKAARKKILRNEQLEFRRFNLYMEIA